MQHRNQDAPSGEPVALGTPLRILIYVDTPLFLSTYDASLLRATLVGSPVQLNVEIHVKLRRASGELTADVLKAYDEIWFFLGRVSGGAPLTASESTALGNWMNAGGGVLIAGDHADDDRMENGKPVYRGLGTHVGSGIPRAGEMRVWDEPPGVKNFPANTTGDDSALSSNEQEKDAAPQRLLLPRFDADRKHPHPIFRDGGTRILDRLPDHPHEGKVRVPSTIAWPGQLEVRIIARGVNWKVGETFDLMADWDGHAVTTKDPEQRFGRILADASFHHYVDFNLVRIARAGGETWDQIQEIFRNQAAWLAPPKLKAEYRERAISWLLGHPLIKEVANEGNDMIGGTAMPLLQRRLPGAWYHEVLEGLLEELYRRIPPDELRALHASLSRDEMVAVAFSLPREEEEILVSPHVLGAYLRYRLEASGRLTKPVGDVTDAAPKMAMGALQAPESASPLLAVLAGARASYAAAVAAARKNPRKRDPRQPDY